VLTRRQFNLRGLRLALAAPLARAFGFQSSQSPLTHPKTAPGFPEGDYTPFGYLNNPFHSWALNRSGVLRSVRGIGFGWHYPTGPGGYFDEKKNGVYSAFLRLGFAIGDRRFWDPEDFREGELRCPYHSSNLITYEIRVSGTRISSTFVQIGENALAARITLLENPAAVPVLAIAAHRYQLGNAEWWGGDGIVGQYRPDQDCLMTRSFAAGTVFVVGSNEKSRMQFFDSTIEPMTAWFEAKTQAKQAIAYGHEPLQGGISYEIAAGQTLDVDMVRGANQSASVNEWQRAKQRISAEIEDKRHEDARFWEQAPRLEGDWPQHWKNGWVYDFETLRMMVRPPIGAYKHSWDAMQIQAPRNVLAETSIDTWALSHADPETAKEVFLGLFLDALEPNVPCMREDGVMNMVAADGSECGTSISWCYPFFSAASIWGRTGDLRWLGELYPRLAKLLRWTVTNRSDREGYIVGKCSWETGMDSARRFLIEQPTGAELIEFIRVVELQAATAHAALVLERFASELGDTRSAPEWKRLRETYAAKTQQLWNGNDWFHDFDTRAGQPIASVGKDIGQVAPISCGVATQEQTHVMIPGLRAFYEQSRAGSAKNVDGWVDGLQWSSLTLPYLESLWTAGEYELAAKVVHMIAERIYPSMDRPTVPKQEGSWIVPREGEARVGIPGVSCEMWTPQGAGGGEGYGWGAVLPAHIMRNLVGIREADVVDRLWLSPSLPDPFLMKHRVYRLEKWRYRETVLAIEYRVQSEQTLTLNLRWTGSRRLELQDEQGKVVANTDARSNIYSCAIQNRKRYRVVVGPSH